MAILKYLRVGDTAELQDNGIRWIRIPSQVATNRMSGVIYESEDGTPIYTWWSDAHAFYYKVTEPTSETDGTQIDAGAIDVKVSVDSGATADYIGAAYNDGAVRVTQNELTYTDGGNFVTLGLADHNTARTALGLAIGTDVQAYSALAASYNAQTYASGSYSRITGASTVGIRTYAEVLTDLSAQAGAAFDFNDQDVTSLGNVEVGDDDQIRLGDSGALDSYVQYDSINNRMEFFDRDWNAVVSLRDLMAGTPLNPVVSGDLSIPGGSLTITDTDNAQSFGLTNDTITSGAPLFLIDSNSLTTESMLKIDAASITGAGMFINCDRGGQQFAVKRYGEVEIAGNAATDMITITAGDILLSDGSLTLTDNDDAATLTIANNAVTDQKLISVTSDGITSGSVLYLDVDGDVGATGNYIECYNGSADVFEVGATGAVIIAGTAGGTDALTITKGDIQVDDGSVEVDADSDIGHYFKRNIASASSTFMLLETTAVDDTGVLLHLDQKCTGNGTVLNIDCAGDLPVIDIDATAARDGDVIDINMANMLDERALYVSGNITAAAGEGLVHLDLGTGVLNATGNALLIEGSGNHAQNSHMVELNYDTGTLAGAGSGFIFGVYDTSSAAATSYAVEIASTNNEALHVNSGKVQVDETIRAGEGIQASAVARTANASAGAGTSQVAAGESFIDVTSAGANNIIVLPVPVLGDMIHMKANGATNFEIRTQANTQYINGTQTSGDEELLATAANDMVAVCTLGGASGKWIIYQISGNGTITAGGTPN